MAELNIRLLKLTSEVSFGDALENLIYRSTPVLSEGLVKWSLHAYYDQIFINLIGSSTLTHYHTTGGRPFNSGDDFPLSNEMILKCETDDVRYLDVFIRILSGQLINVTHAMWNMLPILVNMPDFRKWNDGDIIQVLLKIKCLNLYPEWFCQVHSFIFVNNKKTSHEWTSPDFNYQWWWCFGKRIERTDWSHAPFGNVVVVAPDNHRSGMSNAITVDHPIRVKKTVDEEGFQVL